MRNRAAASRASQLPGVSAATWSASPARREATQAEIRGGFGGGELLSPRFRRSRPATRR